LPAREAELAAGGFDAAAIGRFSAALAEEIAPLPDLCGSEEYKRRLTEVIVRRAIVAFAESEVQP
jgi:CO/xanthine dehydrogenase FAD-binding subunit